MRVRLYNEIVERELANCLSLADLKLDEVYKFVYQLRKQVKSMESQIEELKNSASKNKDQSHEEPFSSFDAKSVMKHMGEVSSKLMKGAELLTDISEVDVGTAPKQLIYEEDKLKLYHYKPTNDKACGVPVLVVYALVNRPYMLDIEPDRSFVRNLLKLGLNVYIIDWGYPTQADRYLSMDDYINLWIIV